MKNGFTLVELMIVVAIIGILAAIAIPGFVEMQQRAKRSEVPMNLDGIKTAEVGYDAAFDGFVPCDEHPSTSPGKARVNWNGGNIGFQTLGWSPDGQVRGQYEVLTFAPNSSTPGAAFEALGRCDVDGDGVRAEYTATKSVNPRPNTANDVY